MGGSSANKTRKLSISFIRKDQTRDMTEYHNKKPKFLNRMCTLVNDSVGKDTPKKKPITTPTNAVMTSLIVSVGFLTPLVIPKEAIVKTTLIPQS